jgi:hypothetical protein
MNVDLHMLRRFLKARDWDLSKAKQMWQEMLAFRWELLEYAWDCTYSDEAGQQSATALQQLEFLCCFNFKNWLGTDFAR